jgi:hypothetical protein
MIDKTWLQITVPIVGTVITFGSLYFQKVQADTSHRGLALQLQQFQLQRNEKIGELHKRIEEIDRKTLTRLDNKELATIVGELADILAELASEEEKYTSEELGKKVVALTKQVADVQKKVTQLGQELDAKVAQLGQELAAKDKQIADLQAKVPPQEQPNLLATPFVPTVPRFNTDLTRWPYTGLGTPHTPLFPNHSLHDQMLEAAGLPPDTGVGLGRSLDLSTPKTLTPWSGLGAWDPKTLKGLTVPEPKKTFFERLWETCKENPAAAIFWGIVLVSVIAKASKS